MFGPPLPRSGPAETAAASGIRCDPRPGERQSQGGGSGNAKRRGPWGCGVGVGSIAISARRQQWPVPLFAPPLPRSGPAETAATSSIRCHPRPGEPQSQGSGSGNTKRRVPWGCGVGGGNIASSAGRPWWPVPLFVPPLPRSGPAETAATSSIRCCWHPGGLTTTSRQGRNVSECGAL